MVNMVNTANFEHGEPTVSGMRDIRAVVMLTEQEDRVIQEFRFAHQVASKSEAMRLLMKRGLETETAITEPARAE